VIGLEDAFLQALFKPEIDAADYRAIVVEFAVRTARARDGHRPGPPPYPAFWAALERIGREAALARPSSPQRTRMSRT